MYDLYPKEPEKAATTCVADSVQSDDIGSCSGFEMQSTTDEGHNVCDPQVAPLNSYSDWASVTDHPLSVKARSHLSHLFSLC